ncbi:receptor-like protein 33 [Setaria viridis]|uniref:receptor-like protein 33 n=1 Tax=Setaria viridis TaxID=4556 RepID=UPI003B3A9F82
MLLELDLNGQFPQKILELKHLTTLELSGNANLMVPVQSLPKGSSLETLALDGINLSIAKPSSFGNLRFLHALHLDARIISKELSSSLSTLDSLEELLVLLNESFLSWIGWIPPEIGNFKNLRILSLHNCSLSGKIPAWIADLKHLSYVNLSTNNLSENFSYLTQTVYLSFARNKLSGQLPDTICKARMLEVLELSYNNFSGQIPPCLIEDVHLGVLCPKWFDGLTVMMTKHDTDKVVRGEHLSRGSYQNIVLITYKGMYMAFEKICTTLTVIDFSDNCFRGRIPDTIGKLVSLHVLNLAHNGFDGKIPNQIGGMTDLESLDLSSNQHSGEIPQELTNLTFLGTLNLSSNQLVGRIPESHQFGTFQSTSFEGNEGLCGAPLPKQCKSSKAPSEPNESKPSKQIDFILYLFSGAGFGIGFAAAVLTKWVHISKWCKIART